MAQATQDSRTLTASRAAYTAPLRQAFERPAGGGADAPGSRNLAIGWDLGGWGGHGKGKDQTFVLLEWDAQGPLQWLGVWAQNLNKGDRLMPLVYAEATDEAELQAYLATSTYRYIALGIDAPLGFPLAFQHMVRGYGLPQTWPKEQHYHWLRNRVAEHYLGRQRFQFRNGQGHVQRHRPLSPSLDSFTNIATLALAHLYGWQAKQGFVLDPHDCPSAAQDRIALEVYPAFMKTLGAPAATREAVRAHRSALFQAYAEALRYLDYTIETRDRPAPGPTGTTPPLTQTFFNLYRSVMSKTAAAVGADDICDAAVCALMAMGYGLRRWYGAKLPNGIPDQPAVMPGTTLWEDLPRPLLQYARQEGWIHHPWLG